MTFGERLKELRMEKELTQIELGTKFNLGKTAISLYETNARFPDKDILEKMADFFKVSVDYLLGRTDIRNADIPKEVDGEFINFYEGYKDLDEAHKDILKATLKAFVDAKKGDK